MIIQIIIDYRLFEEVIKGISHEIKELINKTDQNNLRY